MKYIYLILFTLFLNTALFGKEPENKTLYTKSAHTVRIEQLKIDRAERNIDLHDRRIRLIQKQIFVMNLGLKAPLASIYK